MRVMKEVTHWDKMKNENTRQKNGDEKLPDSHSGGCVEMVWTCLAHRMIPESETMA